MLLLLLYTETIVNNLTHGVRVSPSTIMPSSKGVSSTPEHEERVGMHDDHREFGVTTKQQKLYAIPVERGGHSEEVTVGFVYLR